MRILHILDHSLPLHSGYTFRTRAIMKAQTARGWAVRGVTGVRQGSRDLASVTEDGLQFDRTPLVRPMASPLREIAEIAALARRIDEVVVRFRPDILHAHSPVLNALAALRVARRRGLPLLYEIRAFWEDAAVGNGTGSETSLRYWLTKCVESRAVRRADAIAVICEGLKGDLVSRGVPAGKIMVSPNGVDLALFGQPAPPDEALRAALELTGDVIGYVGSFYHYEGLDDLIAAMPALVAVRPDVKLLLVGGGPVEAALRAQVAASPARDRIVFVGRVPHDRVEHYYGLIDIIVYPRKKMRLTDLVTPLKPLEAMAQGRLVAASDVGGHRELIVDGETGTLFAADSPPAIAEAIAALFKMRESWEPRRAAARAFVAAERDWATNITRYEPVYQRLLKKASLQDI